MTRAGRRISSTGGCSDNFCLEKHRLGEPGRCLVEWGMTFTKLLAQLRAGRGDGTYERKPQNLSRPDLLILDDFGLKSLASPADEDFHDLVCERYEKGSIIITSNRDLDEWGAVFANPVLAEATVDRLRHEAHRAIIKGDSYRKPQPIPKRGKSKSEQ